MYVVVVNLFKKIKVFKFKKFTYIDDFTFNTIKNLSYAF
jgi:hypothetical protein